MTTDTSAVIITRYRVTTPTGEIIIRDLCQFCRRDWTENYQRLNCDVRKVGKRANVECYGCTHD